MEADLDALRQFFPVLADELWADFAAIWRPFDATRKTILTTAGSVERYIYFTLEGVQRVYFIGDDGREATIVFTYAPSFGGVADSFLLQQPSRFWYETLTPSRFLRADFTALDALLLQHHALERTMRQLTNQALSGVLVRQVELQSFSAEARFKILLQRSPQLLQLVPHKYIANYLGMDATNFSKFLGQVRI